MEWKYLLQGSHAKAAAFNPLVGIIGWFGEDRPKEGGCRGVTRMRQQMVEKEVLKVRAGTSEFVYLFSVRYKNH